MTASRFSVRLIAAAALACAASSSHAIIVVSKSLSAFTAATSGTSSTDTFSDKTINLTYTGGDAYTPTPVTTAAPRTTGPYGYTLNTQTDIYVVPVASFIALSSGAYNDTFTFNTFTTPILAFGGNFYRTNILGEVTAGAVTLVATNEAGDSVTTTLSGNSLTGFAGFLSDSALTSIVVSDVVANTDSYVTADNVVLGAVPEASTWLMMLAGGAAVLRLGARRRG
jgi:hypothetical protein